jgi:hypothetical protein
MNSFRRWLASQGICALTGMFVGIVVGFLFEALQLPQHAGRFPVRDLIWIAVALSIVAWIAALFFLGILAGYGVWAMALPSFFTSFVTGVLTIAIDNALWLAVVSVIVGMIVGFAVGRLLCWACRSASSEKVPYD